MKYLSFEVYFVDFRFEFRNRGDKDLNAVRIQVGIPEIGIARRGGPVDLDKKEVYMTTFLKT